jgi:hypothetical protein
MLWPRVKYPAVSCAHVPVLEVYSLHWLSLAAVGSKDEKSQNAASWL